VKCYFEDTPVERRSQYEVIGTTKMEVSERKRSVVGSERRENAVLAHRLGSGKMNRSAPDHRSRHRLQDYSLVEGVEAKAEVHWIQRCMPVGCTG